jgi:membrane fusion protein, copper/silver efflux system
VKSPFLIAILLAAVCGWFASRWWSLHIENVSSQKILYYQSPMHPWVKSDTPGQCNVCGMNLVPVYSGGAGFDKTIAGLVMLPPGSPNVLGVQTAVVKKQRLARTLRVAGMIGEDESRHGIISAPVEGRLDGLAMNHDGQPVSKRQPIATIFSRTLLNAANDYKLALAQGGPALEQAKQKLQRYGLVEEQINGIPQRQPDDLYFGMLSPLTGTIVKSYVSEGQYVKEGDRLFELADFTRMWFMFPVSEQDLPLVHERQVISVRVASLPGAPINARVGFVNPNLSEDSHTAMVRVVLENPERRLKNRSLAEGIIELDAPEVLTVPRSSVLCPGKQSRVYVEEAPGAYEQREVKLGRAGDNLWEILEGVKEGERVVTSGNMLIDGQAQLEVMTNQH